MFLITAIERTFPRSFQCDMAIALKCIYAENAAIVFLGAWLFKICFSLLLFRKISFSFPPGLCLFFLVKLGKTSSIRRAVSVYSVIFGEKMTNVDT